MEQYNEYQSAFAKIDKLQYYLDCLGEDSEITKAHSATRQEIDDHFQKLIDALVGRKEQLLQQVDDAFGHTNEIIQLEKESLRVKDAISACAHSMKAASFFFDQHPPSSVMCWKNVSSFEYISENIKSEIEHNADSSATCVVDLPESLFTTIESYGSVNQSHQQKKKSNQKKSVVSTRKNEPNADINIKNGPEKEPNYIHEPKKEPSHERNPEKERNASVNQSHLPKKEPIQTVEQNKERDLNEPKKDLNNHVLEREPKREANELERKPTRLSEHLPEKKSNEQDKGPDRERESKREREREVESNEQKKKPEREREPLFELKPKREPIREPKPERESNEQERVPNHKHEEKELLSNFAKEEAKSKDSDVSSSLTTKVPSPHASHDESESIQILSFNAGLTSTLAGSSDGFQDGIGENVKMNHPLGVVMNPMNGHLYVCDTNNHAIRQVTTKGEVTTFAKVESPLDIAWYNKGKCFFVSSDNHTISKVSVSGEEVTLIAGMEGQVGIRDGSKAKAKFSAPNGITVDQKSGNLYVSDNGNNLIRKISPQGDVSTFAGTIGTCGHADGRLAEFNCPDGITFFEKYHCLIVCDQNNNKLRRVDLDGEVSTICEIPMPIAVEIINNQSFLVTSNTHKIFKVTHQELEKESVHVEVFAGTGKLGKRGGPPTECQIGSVYGMAVDASTGTFYFTDYYAHLIRKLELLE